MPLQILVLLLQLSEIVDRTQVIEIAQSLLGLTYDHSAEMLPAIIDENLAQLPDSCQVP